MIYVYGRNPAALLASLSSFYPILTPHGYLEIIRILIISVDIGSYVARQSGKKTAGLETYGNNHTGTDRKQTVLYKTSRGSFSIWIISLEMFEKIGI